jgi:hypothetical protein
MMSHSDTRKPWEIEWCLRIRFAASYLDMANLTGQKREFVAGAYGCNGHLDEWCREKVSLVLGFANVLAIQHRRVGREARAKVQDSLDRLYQSAQQGYTLFPVLGVGGKL